MNFQPLIWREPWLAPIVLNIQSVISTRRVESMGITPDGKTLYYDPDYWKSLTKEEQLTSLLHELLHIASRHYARREGREKERWNQACDLSINYLLRQAGYKLPPGCIYDNINDSAEHIYDSFDVKEMESLKKRAERQKSQAADKEKKGSQEDGGRRSEDARTKKRPGDPDVPDAELEKWVPDDIGEETFSAEIGTGGLPLGDDLLDENEDGSCTCPLSTLDAIEKTGILAKEAGTGTTPLSRFFTPFTPKADWRTILQNYVKSMVGDDLDYLTYEFDEFGVCEDVLSPKPVRRICALVDESGSIEDTLYQQFLGELLKMDRFAEVDVSGFTDRTDLNAVPVKKYRRTMTGGTDVRPAYLQACQKEYDCILVLTDGYLEFPETEPVPTIWVMPWSLGKKKEVLI